MTGGGRVCAEADDPFCEHDEISNPKTGKRSGNVWDAARRFISRERNRWTG